MDERRAMISLLTSETDERAGGEGGKARCWMTSAIMDLLEKEGWIPENSDIYSLDAREHIQNNNSSVNSPIPHQLKQSYR